jgi:hypothetical protein
MPTAAEASFAPSPLSSDLRAGIESLSAQQTVTFTQYVKVILPLDGFVYWVKADLLSPSAIYNSALSSYNSVYPNGQPTITTPAKTIVAKGSLHFASTKVQDETESYGVNKITFTSEESLHQDFSKITGNMIYIGTLDDPYSYVRFAFSNRENFYRQADIWHYVGDAIYPFMDSQIIDSAWDINTSQLIVSNSLPLWLNLNNYTPTLPSYGFGNTMMPLFPSHLVQPNTPPPFASVHIYPESTQGLTSTPRIGFRSSHQQLTRERVKITIYGLGNSYAMDFVDCVNQYSSDYDFFGLMNVPIVRDEKMSQNELGIIAQKKSIEYEISYYQLRARDIARQIIGQAIPTFTTIPLQISGDDPENP